MSFALENNSETILVATELEQVGEYNWSQSIKIQSHATYQLYQKFKERTGNDHPNCTVNFSRKYI